MAQRKIGLRPLRFESQRFVETVFRFDHITLARQQDADVVMRFGQRRRALECAAITCSSASSTLPAAAFLARIGKQVAQCGHARNMKYTAPTMHNAAQT